jgi:penicillin amidase
MHLPLGVPTLWYRAQFGLGDGRRLVGPTLPGTPGLVSGSNGSIAWAYTNAYGDWTDLVVVEPDGQGGYRTPEGSEVFQTTVERIEVADGPAVDFEVRETRWGPIVREEPGGRLLARRWVAYEPSATNLGPTYLARARSVAEALDLAPRIGIPAQNLTVVDRDGAIGWTVLSGIPRRRGFDGTVPTSWASGAVGWDGWVGTERPRVVNPAGGQLWTANARVVSGEALAVLGDGGYDLGARAGQIRDGLSALDQATPADLLAIQLDDRALFLARWQALLTDLLAADPAARSEVRSAVANWGGRASVDSPGYRIVRAFRTEVEKRIYDALTAPCRDLDADFSWRNLGLQRPPALWQLVSQRPAHLLPTGFASWEAFLLEALDSATSQLVEEHGTVAAATWGERNRTRMRHPLSPAVPLIGRWVDFPARPLPGDWNMPRVQSPGFGASQRMVVSPGREEEGIFHLPGGQSGHPLSPYYRAGLEAWEEGQATPLLAGPVVERLRLEPRR